jgi:hypothetical protein
VTDVCVALCKFFLALCCRWKLFDGAICNDYFSAVISIWRGSPLPRVPTQKRGVSKRISALAMILKGGRFSKIPDFHGQFQKCFLRSGFKGFPEKGVVRVPDHALSMFLITMK